MKDNIKIFNFKVEQDESKKRLDLYLSFLMPQYSRNFIKKLIESNQVMVNDKVEYKANYSPKQGDRIKIEVDENELKVKNKLVPEKINLDIIYEDENVLAVNKPFGMVVHPADGNWTGTLMNAIAYHYEEQMESVGNSVRAGLIHRLDKETSGIVLVGKSNLGLYHFTKLFSNRKVSKYYLVLAEGSRGSIASLRALETVENFLGRNPKNRKKVRSYRLDSEIETQKVRLAKTTFYKLATKENKILLLAKPETGRTHQIRVHVTDLGLKIVGDSIYGKADEGMRMMLHAYILSLHNIDSSKLKLVAKPQEDFQRILQKFGFDFKSIENKVDNLVNLKT